jgi:hypothetical protein
MRWVIAVVLCSWPLGVAAQLSTEEPASVTADAARERAWRHLRRHRASLGVDPGALVVERTHTAHGFTITRFRRVLAGAPVFLRSVVVREHGGRVEHVVVAFGSPRDDATPPSVDASTVEDDARRRVAAASGVESRRVGLDIGGVVRLGYLVEVDGASPIDRWLLVYGGGGELLHAAPRAVHALGRVYDPNPPNAMMMTSDVELSNLESSDRLTGRYVRSFGCNVGGAGCSPRQTAVADAAGDFLYDPVEPSYLDPFSEVSGYFHADRMAGYFDETHGFVWTCCDAAAAMDVIVNFTERPGIPYDNASYSPSSCGSERCGFIALGQSRIKDFAYDGDVVYHEFTHAVVDVLAGIVGFDFDDLGVSYEPGGINEGTADYFSATVAGDPRVAEYFTGASGIGGHGALRELDNDLSCPTGLFGEGHLDGRIWGRTGWLVRETVGREKADALMFTTLASMVDNTNFAGAADLLVETAEAMVGAGTLDPADEAAVLAAVDATGIRGCQRIVPLDDGEQRSGYSGVPFATGTIGGSVVPLHYSIDVPVDATKLTLSLNTLTAAGEYTYYLRTGRPNTVVPTRRPPLAFDASAPAERTVEIVEGGALPLPRCQTLFIALRAEDLQSAGESVYLLSARLDRSGDPAATCPVVEVDAGPADAGADGGPRSSAGRPGGGGCDCRAAPGGRGGGWLAAGLLIAAAARRRSVRGSA